MGHYSRSVPRTRSDTLTRVTTLLRDLIPIPEAVHKGDFVMSLAKGVEDGAATLEHYVVTDQLARAYDNALGFIASAVKDGTSKAAYLDGSFGSGKSHFMAVLHLLLRRDPAARAVPELAEPIARHDSVLSVARFELVPFHMIGAESMEQRIFGGYVEHLRRVDPDAPPPGVYADGPIFEQAALRREELGDDAFFAKLNNGAGAGGDDGWGDLAAAWNADSYARAFKAEVGDPDRGRLTGAIVAQLMPGFREAMSGNTTGYVDFDTGLAELARHAKDRGADALILFLDELILWLGSRIADPAFVAREGQKLIKLVEFSATRPIPIISFVARQRDLREFVGDQVPGADKLSFVDALKHWNDRFHRVELHDRNLPKIAERRLLTPVSPAARQQLDDAFAATERSRQDVLDVLMTEDGDRDLFRSTYPFSPAFMKVLVAASSALQRERTALRVMLQLLVDRRDELEVGDLVSVGDLFDVLAHGDEPFSDDLKRHFQHAKELYDGHLRPLLLAEMPGATQPAPADDRLVKTLLLAALVPQAQPLRALDVAKLTALNHGSIVSPIPGQEKAIVLQKLRKWSSQVGALKVGEDPHNPTVTIRLTGVDVDSIIERAESVDNPGARRLLVRELVLAQMGIEADTRLFNAHTMLWRGTRREIDVAFGNVRDTEDLPDDQLRAVSDRWKLVIDYPFDQGHTPLEDLDRLDRWRQDHGASRTVCWIPAFFSTALQRDLKRLVVIRHVLSGERLTQYTDHLSPQDRQQAAGILSDLRSALEQRVAAAIRQAYGVERAVPDTIDTSHGIEDRLQSLSPGFAPQVPVGAQLADALNGLVDQMLCTQFPEHPRFETEIRARDLRTVLEEVQRAVQAPDGRLEVASDRRKVMLRIAAPLRLGEQYEVAFLLGSHWKDLLERAAATARREEAGTITVADVREWIDASAPMGLTRDVQSLVVMAFAAQTGRAFQLHGGPATPSVDRLDDALELVTTELPDETNWRVAVQRAASVLGLAAVNPALTPLSLETLVAELRVQGAANLDDATTLVGALERRMAALGIDAAAATRFSTARAAAELVSALVHTGPTENVIFRFAGQELPSAEAAVGKSIASAGSVVTTLSDSQWAVIDLVADRARGGDEAFQRIIDELVRALEHDEFAEPVAPALADAAQRGLALLRPDPDPEPDPDPDGDGVVIRGDLRAVGAAAARAKLDELAGADGDVRIDLSWKITTRDDRT